MKTHSIVTILLFFALTLSAPANEEAGWRLNRNNSGWITSKSVPESFPLKVEYLRSKRSIWASNYQPPKEQSPDFEILSPFSVPSFNEKFLKVTNGWLVALDSGEFGSWFGWYSEDGQSHYEISKDRVHNFWNIHGFTYISGGGAGGNVGTYGFICKVIFEHEVWQLRDTIRFPTCVWAISKTRDSGYHEKISLLVLTDTLIYRVDNQGKRELVYGFFGYNDKERAQWRYYDPNSIAELPFEGGLFVGTNHGVVRIKENYPSTELWLIPEVPTIEDSSLKKTEQHKPIENFDERFDKLFE